MVFRFLPIIAFCLFTQTAALASGTLKVLTLNYNSEVVLFDDSQYTIRDMRFNALVRYLKEVSPDIVLLQEGWNYHCDASVAISLARAVGYDYFYALGVGFPGIIQDSDAVLAKKELHLSATHEVTLPHSAPYIGDFDSQQLVIPLGAVTKLVGGFVTLPNGSALMVYSTHLLGDTSSDVTEQVNALDQNIRIHGYRHGFWWDQVNVLVAGDMNSDPTTPQMKRMETLGYTDAWTAVHPDHISDNISATNCGTPKSNNFNPLTAGSNQVPAQNEPQLNQRFDHIFTRGSLLKPIAATVVFTHPYGGFWMSDHYGVLTTFAIGESENPIYVPNPLTDTPDNEAPGLATIFRFNDEVFAECKKQDPRDECIRIAKYPVSVTSSRGLVLAYRGDDKMRAQIDGPGKVRPSSNTALTSGQIAAFVFMKSGDYTMTVTDLIGDQLIVHLNVRL